MVVESERFTAEENGDVAPLLIALEWDKVHHSPTDAAVSLPSTSPWPMVSIRKCQDDSNKNRPIMFPPIDHENLQISSNTHSHNASTTSPVHILENSDLDSDSDSVTNSNSSSSFSPSESSPVAHCPLFSSPKSRQVPQSTTLFGSWTKILYFKVNDVLRYIRARFASSPGIFKSFHSAWMTSALFLFLYFRQRRRLRVGEESRAQLIGIVKERDEKIKQLLDQISGMNQVLLALHRVSTTNPST